MFTFITVLFTLAMVGAVYWIYSSSKKKDIKQKWYVWAACGLWIAFFAVGLSFVILNIYGGHSKAASTGVFLFFIPAIIFAILILRLAKLLEFGKKELKS